METKEESNSKYCFGENVKIFLHHIESLSISLPIVLKTIEDSYDKAKKAHNDFLNTKCEPKEGEKGIFLIKPEQKRKNVLLKNNAIRTSLAYKMIQSNYIVSLISQFDALIGSLIRTIYYKKPELLNNSEKQLTFSNLINFSTIEDAREYIIEKEIEGVLRENHTEHFKWIENKLNVKLRKDLPIWPTFIELTERRNLYVHNNGKVNNQYLKICTENAVKFKEEIHVGDDLILDLKYFENAFSCLFELGVKLSQVIWRKLQPDDLEKCDDSLLNISFELIQNERYNLAKILLDFMDKYINKFSSVDVEYRLIFNRAQTYKWIGENEMCKKIVKSKDWSACNDLFRLASQVLLDEFDEASKTMERIGVNDEILPRLCYTEWPIFREFRKQEKFKSAYKKIYKEDFETSLESVNAT